MAGELSRSLAVESWGQCPPCKQGCTRITERLLAIEVGRGSDADLGEVPVAFVVARREPAGLPDRLRAHLAERGVARYKWPVEVRVLQEIPLSGPGKVDRRTLRELASRPAEAQWTLAEGEG